MEPKPSSLHQRAWQLLQGICFFPNMEKHLWGNSSINLFSSLCLPLSYCPVMTFNLFLAGCRVLRWSSQVSGHFSDLIHSWKSFQPSDLLQIIWRWTLNPPRRMSDNSWGWVGMQITRTSGFMLRQQLLPHSWVADDVNFFVIYLVSYWLINRQLFLLGIIAIMSKWTLNKNHSSSDWLHHCCICVRGLLSPSGANRPSGTGPNRMAKVYTDGVGCHQTDRGDGGWWIARGAFCGGFKCLICRC